jgi:hypothetical protein
MLFLTIYNLRFVSIIRSIVIFARRYLAKLRMRFLIVIQDTILQVSTSRYSIRLRSLT